MINSTHGCILGRFYVDDETRTNVFTSRHIFVRSRKQQLNSTCGCILLQTQRHDANFEQNTTYTRIQS